MLVLGLDTSGLQLAVVLLRDGALAAQASYAERREQGEVLLPLIDDCLKQANSQLADIKAVAVVTGPGSFTGLRLGLAAAQGLVRVLSCPAAGYDRFSLMRQALQDKPVAIVLDSLRAELFVQFPGTQPQMLTPEQIAALWSGPITGDGVSQLPGRTIVDLPKAAELAARQIAIDMASGKKLLPLQPFYLRAPDVTGVPAA